MKKPLFIVVGPTATGKTSIGIELSKRLNGEIISADSAQIYKGMDIGTAKPSMAERAGIVHHMIDIITPDTPYSVACYQKDALDCIHHVIEKGKIPIVVGGTGLYINAITYPMTFANSSGDPQIRNKWDDYAKGHGVDALHSALQERDPETANRLHPNDVKRVVRALEVFESTGKPFSAHRSSYQNAESEFNICIVGLTMDREKLYARIEQRVDEMMTNGLLSEVESLTRQYSTNFLAFQALGYKEIIAYIQKECSLDESVSVLKRNTRRYAKRQLTWFNRDKRIHWHDVGNVETCVNLADEIVSLLDVTLFHKS